MTSTTDDLRFSTRLREATAVAHRDAERSAFVHRLFRGQLPLDGVADLTAQLWFVYGALEATGSDLADDPVVAALTDPRLARVSSLESDLCALLGPEWPGRVRPLPATEDYVRRIVATAAAPPRYVAHHYTRLLGDLSGGQMIRRTLDRHHGDEVSGALSFYDLSHLGDLDAYKDRYRRALDEVPWGDVERCEAVDEANAAFAANAAVFADLDRSWPD